MGKYKLSETNYVIVFIVSMVFTTTYSKMFSFDNYRYINLGDTKLVRSLVKFFQVKKNNLSIFTFKHTLTL